MAETDPKDQKTVVQYIKDHLGEWAFWGGLASSLATGVVLAWEKLAGVRPMVVATLLVAVAFTIAAFYRMKRKAKAELKEAEKRAKEEGGREALTADAAADADRPLTEFLLVETYADPRRRHGIILHRGGHARDYRISVRLGIRLTNYSYKCTVRVREIQDVLLSYERTTIHHEKLLRLAENREPIDFTQQRVHVHTIDVPFTGSKPQIPHQPYSIHVQGKLLIVGDWGDDPKELSFSEDILVPVQMGYTPEMYEAVNRLRDELDKRYTTLIDADLQPDEGSWVWTVSAAPQVRTMLPVEVQSSEEARKPDRLRVIADKTVEVIRAQFAEQSNPRRVRVSGSEVDAKAEQELAEEEAEAVEDAGAKKRRK